MDTLIWKNIRQNWFLQSRKEKTILVGESGIVSLNLRIVENDAVRNYILICNFGRGIL